MSHALLKKLSSGNHVVMVVMSRSSPPDTSATNREANTATSTRIFRGAFGSLFPMPAFVAEFARIPHASQRNSGEFRYRQTLRGESYHFTGGLFFEPICKTL